MRNQRIKYPIGVQDFEKVQAEGYLYLDKTEYLYALIKQGCYHFLARPRRFGKSMLLSTIQAFFEGKKEYFDGTIGQRLAIADKEDVTWVKRPVLKLDLNADDYKTADILRQKLDSRLREWESQYPTGYENYSLGTRFNFSSETRNIEKYIIEEVQ